MSTDGVTRPTVVCVDDDGMVLDLLATMLDRVGEFEIEVFTDPVTALRRIREGDVDCIVSDFEMPELDGLELLERSRAVDVDLPFILYTARGGEDVAVEAISRGVTDYFRKEPTTTQYVRLGNRVEEAVARYHAARAIDRHVEAMETAREGICIVREDGTIQYANEAFLDLHGYRAEELIDAESQLLDIGLEIERALSEGLPAVEERDEWWDRGVGTRVDGTTYRRGTSVTSLPDGGLVLVTVDLDDLPWEGDDGVRDGASSR